MINPDWMLFSCQDCAREVPFLKELITDAAEDVIKLTCSHKKEMVK